MTLAEIQLEDDDPVDDDTNQEFHHRLGEFGRKYSVHILFGFLMFYIHDDVNVTQLGLETVDRQLGIGECRPHAVLRETVGMDA